MSSQSGEFTRFIGRRHELSEVRHLLAGSRLVTLTGIGGAGKTRIARRVTADATRSFRDGAYFVELADLHDPSLLGHTVAGALGLQVQGAQWDLGLLTGYLHDRHVLLTLDNCEHLGAECAQLVVALLEGCPDLKVLATSRMPLGLVGEAVFQVPPLSVPDADHLPPLEGLGQYESITLFLDRAGSALPSFKLTSDNAEAVARLVVALEGIPLALELAAARIRVLSPEAMLERISDRYHLLSRGYRDAPSRQQSLIASVEWSYDLCTPDEQTMWSRLAVFAGGFELDAAEEICSSDDLPKAAILDLVSSLLDKSVLVRNDDVAVRYRMLETIRQYGVAQLEASDEHDLWRQRHRDWYAELAARSAAEWVGPHQVRWVERLRSEHPNLRAALELVTVSPEQAPIGLRMCHDLEQFWICTGLLSEARHWCEQALAQGTGTDVERSLALRICVWFASLQMDLDYAQARLDEARPLVERAGDDVALGYFLYGAGMLATWQADVDRGVPLLLDGIEAFRRAGHLNGEVNLLFLTGMCLAFAERAEEARDLQEACLALTEPREELFMRSYALWALGLDAFSQGDIARATRLEREGLRMKAAVTDHLGVALITEALSWIAAAEDRGERSATLLGAADVVWQHIGMSMTELPYIRETRAVGEALARGTLSPKAFERAFSAGSALSIDQTLSLALEEVAEVPVREAKAASPLTPREQEVAELIGEGLSNRDIAGRLVISQRTAQGHVENILRKLGFTSRAQVAAWVAERKAAEAGGVQRHLRAVEG